MSIMINEVRLSYPHLWTPSEYKGNLSFQANFLIPKESPQGKQLMEAVDEAARKAYGDKWQAMLQKLKGDKTTYCIKDGDLEEGDENHGMWVLKGKSKQRPLVVDADRTPLAEADGKPYAGCYVNALVEIFGQTNEHKGIRCKLKGVQFVRDGDAFGAADVPADVEDFPDLAGDLV
jgi:hypothetical protein